MNKPNCPNDCDPSRLAMVSIDGKPWVWKCFQCGWFKVIKVRLKRTLKKELPGEAKTKKARRAN